MGFSRFYLCDLQVHTPADANHGYGDVGGREPNEAFAHALIAAHRDAGVEVIAITDHNRVDWYPALRSAGDDLGVFVFPGLEFSVNGCHLLAIWDRTDDGFDLAKRFLAMLWPPKALPFSKDGHPNTVTQRQVGEWADEAARHDALVFAPHATKKSMGIFGPKVCRNSREIAQSGKIAGFDVVGDVHADVLTNPATKFGTLAPPWFISGDVRDHEAVGKRAAYFKLGSSPTLEGLRQAFLLPTERIRFPSHLQQTWGHVKSVAFVEDVAPRWAHLDSVHIQGGFHGGLFVEFGPGLNAIIGGKGTGKSGLVETIRFVLSAEGPSNEDLRRTRQHVFPPNAEAFVKLVTAESQEYEAERAGTGQGRLLRSGKDAGVDVGRRFTVRVFGQRELQDLGQRSESLRDFVASVDQIAWSELEKREAELLRDLRSEASQLEALHDELVRLEEAEEELDDLKERLAVVRERGVESLLDEAQRLIELNRQVTNASNWPARVESAAGELLGVLRPPTVPDSPLVPSEIATTLAALAQATTDTVKELESAAQEAMKSIAPHTISAASDISQRRDEIERELGVAGVRDLSEIKRWQERQTELQETTALAPAKRTDYDARAQSRLERLHDLERVRREMSRHVVGAAQTLTSRVAPRVRVAVSPLGTTAEVLAALESIVSRQRVRREQLQSVASHPPRSIADAIRTGSGAIEHLGCNAGTAGKLAQASLAQIHRLEESATPDEVTVEIEIAPGEWQAVSDVSPGQRATAMLALALATGEEPLILDQPEDDLDNRYIFDEVVPLLRSVCRSRQVIVVTHNANIPVLGDAEMILALEASSGQSTILAAGGLEEPQIAECARSILEGGDEAFRARQRRYERSSA